MSVPVDLTNLRSITDGDKEMEQALFEEFVSSSEESLSTLQNSVDNAFAETWRKEAHALKGVALNLGAIGLGALCKKAQDEFNASPDFKADLLKKIREEYALVKQFLSELA